MHLKLEIPGSWLPKPQRPRAKLVVYEPAPGVTLTLEPLRPLPTDLREWGDEIVLRGVDLSMYRIRNVDDLHTVRGWPVSIFFSDILSILPESSEVGESQAHAPRLFGEQPSFMPPSAPRVLERRLHALYIFDEHCAAACARSADTTRFDDLMPELRRVLLTGEPDWSGERVTSLHELFRELVTFSQPPESVGDQTAPQEADQVK